MYGFMDKEWLDDDSINETTLSDWIKEKFSDSETVCDFVGKWFVRRGYKLDESLDNVPESILQMVEDDARDILNPHEAPELQKSLETDSPFDRHMESVASKFDKCMSKIWECMSTDMMGNSQPTTGVFSGDNFAAGDLRQPVLLGGYSRFGKIRKNKRRKIKPMVGESVEAADAEGSPRLRGKKLLRPMSYNPSTMGELIADKEDKREWADTDTWVSRDNPKHSPMRRFIRNYVEDFVHNQYPVRGLDTDKVENALWKKILREWGGAITQDTPTWEIDDGVLNYLYRTTREIIRKYASKLLDSDVMFPDDLPQ